MLFTILVELFVQLLFIYLGSHVYGLFDILFRIRISLDVCAM